MPQRRISTPIPPWSFPWIEFVPTVTWFSHTPAVWSAIGLYRPSVGIVEYEVWITFTQETPNPTGLSFPMLISGFGSGTIVSQGQGEVQDPAIYGTVSWYDSGTYQDLCNMLDFTVFELLSSLVYMGTSFNIPDGDTGTIHITGYYPRLIP